MSSFLLENFLLLFFYIFILYMFEIWPTNDFEQLKREHN